MNRPAFKHDAEPRARARFEVSGRVQGVGFRPFVYRLATRHDLSGWVRNTTAGVSIEVEGDQSGLDAFERGLFEAPPNAVLEIVSRRACPPVGGGGFEIRAAQVRGALGVRVPLDTATCATCLGEIRDPNNRRYRYPFTNCTDCGPRYSTIERMPYARAHTTMRTFELCAACADEYCDPNDRRFHTEALCCPACGPRLVFMRPDGAFVARADDALAQAIATLEGGGIVAVKGLGGFQLCVRADDAGAIARLRAAKGRGGKPFAVMYPSLAALGLDVELDEVATGLLLSPAAPIVIATRRPGARACETVAPACPDLGAMLPTTALHHLLLEGVGGPLVVTSGNRSEAPLCIDDDEAIVTLGPLADGLLSHDRPIANPLDDSVVGVYAGRALVLRRARGYAPFEFDASSSGDTILAVGAQGKNALALARGRGVVLGAHIGDLDHEQAACRFERGTEDLPALYGEKAVRVAHDKHPDYLATRVARTRGLPAVAVQHHHAHVVACMGEHDLHGEVLGVAFDGSGDGGDGTVWGGECLAARRDDFTRVASLHPFALVGGEQAIREPGRVALALADAAGVELDPDTIGLDARSATNLRRLLDKGAGVGTTSVGRLFDGVAVLLGLCHRPDFEAEAACRLEYAARADTAGEALHFEIACGTRPWTLDWRPLVRRLVQLQAAGTPPAALARGFHIALADALVGVAARAGIERVCLSGGCFQNRLLESLAVSRLEAAGHRVYTHRRVPPNDGGIAFGQALVAAARTEH